MTFRQSIILVIVFLITAGLTKFASHSEIIKPNKPFKEFPLQIDQWKGHSNRLEDKVYNVLGVEDYILANYFNPQKEMVNLYVGFYQSQKKGDIIHSPKNCMPGSGWNIASTGIETVKIHKLNKEIKVIKLLLVNGAQKQVVYYWFQSRGRIISSEYMQKIWLVVDSIFKHRTDGSFVRLISPVIKDEKTTDKILKSFVDRVYPILTEFIPS